MQYEVSTLQFSMGVGYQLLLLFLHWISTVGFNAFTRSVRGSNFFDVVLGKT